MNLPDLLGVPMFALTDKTNIVLTSVIGPVCCYSRVLSLYSGKYGKEKKRNEIKAVSDELEKAYGPISAILNRPLNKEGNVIELLVNDKLIMDEKFLTYRCMFSQSVTEYWAKKIRNLEARISHDSLAGAHILASGQFTAASGMVDVFEIPVEFVDMFNSEYMNIIAKQQDLLTS